LPTNSKFDFYKKILYNIYIKIEKGNKSHMDTYYESFACEIQSDENWVEQLIQMENINRLLEEDKE
jgi:hypothetical protein